MSYKISILKIKHLKSNREKQVLLVAYFFWKDHFWSMLVYCNIINRENKSMKPAKETQCLKRKIYNRMECSLPFTEALTLE